MEVVNVKPCTLVDLPHDVLLRIYDFSDLTSFLQLIFVHPLLNKKIKELSAYILSKECTKMVFSSKLHFYYFIDHTYNELLVDCKKRYLRQISRILTSNTEVILLKREIMRNLHLFQFAPYPKVNRLFAKLMIYYIQYNTFIDYPNKFDLIAFYVFSTALYTKSMISINHATQFLDRLAGGNSEWKSLCVDYFSSILNFSFININFATLYTITKYTVNFTTLWKMFVYKPLNLCDTILLSNTECQTKVNKILCDICSLKFQYPEDELIGHNFNEIKNILQTSSATLSNSFIFMQKLLINKEIFITHPINKTKIRFQSRQYVRMMQHLNRMVTETTHQPNVQFYTNCVRKIRREIRYKQKVLLRKYFS